MSIVEIESTYAETELPELVYKYRFWDTNHSFHKRILANQEVYFAAPKDFEDTLDCKNLVRWDLLTNNQIYDRYLQISYRENLNYTRAQHENYAQQGFNQSPLRDKDLVAQLIEDDFNEFNDRIGILSLTEYNNSLPMWKKYAGDHTGICVGFDARETFETFHGGGKVEYFENLPIVYPTPIHTFAEQINFQIYSKEKKWSFEQEYRTIKFFQPGTKASTTDRLISLPKTAIREVIIGSNASDATISEVKSILESELRGVKLLFSRRISGLIEIVSDL